MGLVSPESISHMNKLILANLVHRPLRSIISIFAVAIEVVMILSIVAVFMGMLHSQNQRTNGIGADIMLLPSNASLFNGVSGASMPVNDAIVLRRLPHVTVVAPVIQHLSTSGTPEILYGIDYDTFNALKPFVFLSGSKFQGPNDVLVDNVFAAQRNPATGKPYAVGDTVQILDQPFRICGIVEEGKGGRKLIPIDTMARLVGAEGHASIFYIRCDNPANDNLVMQEIRSTPGFGNNTMTTVDSWLHQMTPDKIPGFKLSLSVVTTIAVVIGFLVILQSMYTAVLERTREIGILKSMGASKPAIIGMVLRETALLAALGVAVGIAGTFGVKAILAARLPTFAFEVTGAWVGYGILIAVAGSMCGALYPAWMAARKDPIDALAYE